MRDANLMGPVLIALPLSGLESGCKKPDRKTWVGMSEYPCTGIDKATLKFALQDSKISQIVSVRISAFFLIFVRQFLPDLAFQHDFEPSSAKREAAFLRLPEKAYVLLSSRIPLYCSLQKNRCRFFSGNFSFLNNGRTFFLHRIA